MKKQRLQLAYFPTLFDVAEAETGRWEGLQDKEDRGTISTSGWGNHESFVNN
jgi:hypothetical protein